MQIQLQRDAQMLRFEVFTTKEETKERSIRVSDRSVVAGKLLLTIYLV